MNQSQITLIVIGFMLVALMATNPSLEDHRQAFSDKMQDRLTESSGGDNQWEKVGQAIGMALGQGIVEKAVRRENYILFSITRISFMGRLETIGFGVFGKVWITNQLDKKEYSNESNLDSLDTTNEIFVDTVAYTDTTEDGTFKNETDVSSLSSNADNENFILDGQTSEQVTIGSQIWMVQNLNLDTFRNGDLIPHAKTNEEWWKAEKNQQPAWSYYNNDPANGAKYGKLYNWYAVIDPRGLAPAGWHIPSDAEWTKLEDFLGTDAGKKMKSISGWNKDGNGTNSSGFSGLPGGFRDFNGTLYYIGNFGYWWSSTEGGTTRAWLRKLDYGYGDEIRYTNGKGNGLSVRCLRD
jgi:uncharacterized protein (TIGR02145 family)